MKKSIFIFLTVAVLASCGENLPEGILERDKMVGVLIRIHIAEAKTNNSYRYADSIKSYYQVLEDTIFKNYNTNKADFDKSYQYYMKDPTKMEKIYAEVVDSLSFREGIKKID